MLNEYKMTLVKYGFNLNVIIINREDQLNGLFDRNDAKKTPLA